MLNIHDEQGIEASASVSLSEERKQASTGKTPGTPGQRWWQRFLSAAKRYPVPCMAITLMLASLAFWLAGRRDIADWTLLAVALLGGIPLLWETM